MNLQPTPEELSGKSDALPFRLLGTEFTRMKFDAPVILLVDGAEPRRRSVAAVLEGLGYRFVEAGSTQEAARLLCTQKVDLVITDLLAPDLGGVALVRSIRTSPGNPLLPVIVVSRRGHIDQEVLALEAGADAVLPQTIHPRSLRASVQSCLKRKAEIDAMDETETVLFTLAQSVEERDPDLGAHCERLALMAAALGVALGLASDEILALQRGGYLHDVGKIAIPDNVLFKPGPLTPDEWVIMQSHAERGERICRNVRSLAPVLPIIRSHHEKWDGTGYPDGLKGEEIPLLARIIQLADIYDALTTIRPYKRAFSTEKALEIMLQEAEKGWRDPRLVKTFVELLPMFQTPCTSELSELSLHALASSIERYRTSPFQSAELARNLPVRMASGL